MNKLQYGTLVDIPNPEEASDRKWPHENKQNRGTHKQRHKDVAQLTSDHLLRPHKLLV